MEHFTTIPRRFTRITLTSLVVALATACDEPNPTEAEVVAEAETEEPTPADLPAEDAPDHEAVTSLDEEPSELDVEPPMATPRATAYITGRVTYKPDFYTLTSGSNSASMNNSYVGRGRVPSADSSYSPVRYLFICAYEADGLKTDFRSNSEGDDDLLGCARADMFGRYTIPIERSGQDDDVYLVTSFCDNPQVSITVPGTSVTYDDVPEVCIRPNYNATTGTWTDLNEGGGDPKIKYLTTRAHTDRLAASGETRISWNLSCPLQDGYKPSDPQFDPVICTGSGNGTLEPTETEVGTIWAVPSWAGNTNSSIGFNKEFTHMFVSMMENSRWYGTYKPDDTNALGGGACSTTSCQGAIYVYACDAFQYPYGPYENPGIDGSGCGARTLNAREITINHRCPSSGADVGTCGDLNPHVVTHELGHVMQFRWGQSSGSGDLTTYRHHTLEGWADFVALATWYTADAASSPNAASDPHFNSPSYVAEAPAAFSGDNWTENTCGSGNGCNCSEGNLYALTGNNDESREAMFFWDLYDTATDGGSDNVALDFGFIRSHWNLFSDLNNDGDLWDEHETKECVTSSCTGDDGVNLEDFQWWWDELRPLTGAPSLDPIMSLNCTDRHPDGLNCTTGASVCDP